MAKISFIIDEESFDRQIASIIKERVKGVLRDDKIIKETIDEHIISILTKKLAAINARTILEKTSENLLANLDMNSLRREIMNDAKQEILTHPSIQRYIEQFNQAKIKELLKGE